MHAASDAIIASTLDRVILSWSRGAEKLYGYSAEEAIGGRLDILIPPEQQPQIESALQRVAAGESVEAFEATRLARAGNVLQVEMSLTPITDNSGAVFGVLAITRDVSGRKQSDKALRSRLEQQAAVAALGQRALADIPPAALMNEAAHSLTKALGVEYCKILRMQPDERTLLLVAGTGWRDGLVGHALVPAEAESQAGYTLRCRAPVIVEDLRRETRLTAPTLLREHDVISGISVIIQGRERPFGVLGVHAKTARKFTEDDIHFVQAIANVLAAAIQRSEAEADREARAKAERAVAEMEVSVHQRAVVMETATHVALDILSSRTGVEALRHIADAARVLAGARYAALGVARPDTLTLMEFITVGLTPREEAAIGPRPKGAGVLGVLLTRTDPLRVDVLADHPASVGFPPNHPPMDSFLGVPIRRGDTTVGSLYLTNKQGGGAFTEADEVAVQALGAHAAVAIHNLHMLTRQRALVASLITAQEEERRTIAYDLHDGLTQYVMSAHAHLESFRRAVASDSEEKAAQEIEQSVKYLKEAVVESRRLVNGLRLLSLEDLGLSGALEQLLSEEKERCDWQEAEFRQNIGDRRFDKMLETGVYRVAQEALTNVRKHARASRVQLRLTLEAGDPKAGQQGEYLRLEVRDWGRGFEPERAIETGHFGLHGMSERTGLLGGTCSLRSAPGEGTIVAAGFPLAAASPGGSP